MLSVAARTGFVGLWVEVQGGLRALLWLVARGGDAANVWGGRVVPGVLGGFRR